MCVRERERERSGGTQRDAKTGRPALRTTYLRLQLLEAEAAHVLSGGHGRAGASQLLLLGKEVIRIRSRRAGAATYIRIEVEEVDGVLGSELDQVVVQPHQPVAGRGGDEGNVVAMVVGRGEEVVVVGRFGTRAREAAASLLTPLQPCFERVRSGFRHAARPLVLPSDHACCSSRCPLRAPAQLYK